MARGVSNYDAIDHLRDTISSYSFVITATDGPHSIERA
jgi:hypothetical protein